MGKGKIGADNSLKVVKPRGKGKPFEKGNKFAFKSGETGNAGGAPKGERFETTIARYMERDGATVAKLVDIALDPSKMKGITFQDVLILRTLGAYCNDPNGSFFQVLRETKEGKLVEKAEIETNVNINDPRERLTRLIDSVATRRPKIGDSSGAIE